MTSRYYSRFTNTVLIAAIIWFVATMVLHLWFIEPMAGGLKAPDVRPFGYGLADIAPWFERMDEGADRAFFLKWHTGVFDRIQPWLLSLGIFLAIYETINSFPRFARQRAWLRALVPLFFVLPFLIADVAENSQVAAMVSGSHPVDAMNVGIASALTVSKFVFSVVMFAVLAVFTLTLRARQRKDLA